MNIPNWVLVLFGLFGLGFMLLGPELPIWNLAILCGVVLLAYAILSVIGSLARELFAFSPSDELPKARQRGDPIDDKEVVSGFVEIGHKVFAVIDSHINGQNMTKREYQDYMNGVTVARSETGQECHLPVCNTSYRMTTGDQTAGGHNGDWRDDA